MNYLPYCCVTLLSADKDIKKNGQHWHKKGGNGEALKIRYC